MENLILLIILSALGILIYFGVQQTKKTRQQMMDELDELEDTIYGNLPEANPTVSAATAAKTEEKVKTEPTVSAATAAKTEEKVTEAAKPKKYYKKKGRPAKPKN
jgi:TRAP-type C4-dicarboxylate transport system permease small subunit